MILAVACHLGPRDLISIGMPPPPLSGQRRHFARHRFSVLSLELCIATSVHVPPLWCRTVLTGLKADQQLMGVADMVI